jgi:hypothetical protein
MKNIEPQLIADVTLYASSQGGLLVSTSAEWFGCLCKVKKADFHGWDCRILLNGIPLVPGETRRVVFIFLSGEEAARTIRQAGRFYLWEGRIIGEAEVVQSRFA